MSCKLLKKCDLYYIQSLFILQHIAHKSSHKSLFQYLPTNDTSK